MVFGKTVVVIEKDKDRWGRTVAHVLVDGEDTKLLWLKAKMAWHYQQYSKNKRLQQAEDDARAAKSGLWPDRNPVARWDWRKGERDRQKKAK